MMSVMTEIDFGVDTFLDNAVLYAKNKRIVDAASQYDCLDDAVVALTTIWEQLEGQLTDGAGFTPPAGLGFGSDNASQIAAAILGRKTSVGAIRKAFSDIGKKPR